MGEEEDRPIEVGDRFEDKDWRAEGRVVEVRDVLVEHRFLVQAETNPKNPGAVGHRSIVSGHTLRTRYKRISR